MSYFECFSVTVLTIYCLNPKLRLFFVQNWVLLYINENAKCCVHLSRSSYYRFTFGCLFFRYLVQNKQIILLKYYEYQLTKRCLEGRLKGFKVSSWFLKIMELIEYRKAKKCHDFHHCCIYIDAWLHYHYSRGCHVRFYFMKQSNSDNLILTYS